jgi:hypothetical protein
MVKLVYYSQEDPRWRNIMYSNHNDKTQTIGTSACGPTSAAMAVSSLTDKTVLPPSAAAYAVEKGYRTYNDGTAWSFFSSFVKQYGLECVQTGNLNIVKSALASGALVVASMRPGHFTAGGHYILLVGLDGDMISVHDPNQDNRKYGSDGLVDQGVRDDGKVKAKTSVFAKEAGQYWIITKLKEEDEPMTAAEKKEFEVLQKAYQEQTNVTKNLSERITAIEEKHKMKVPTWAETAVQAAVKAGIVDTPDGGSEDFYRVLTIIHRKELI